LRRLPIALLLIATTIACSGMSRAEAEKRIEDVVTRTVAAAAQGDVGEPVGADGDPWSSSPCGPLLGTGEQTHYRRVVQVGRGADAAAERVRAYWSSQGFEVSRDGAREGALRYELSVDHRLGHVLIGGSTPCYG
jgi:hypothetical protein